jgi:hypothetical protein
MYILSAGAGAGACPCVCAAAAPGAPASGPEVDKRSIYVSNVRESACSTASV